MDLELGLMRAIAFGTEDDIRREIANGAPVNGVSISGQSPLAAACKVGWNTIARELIARGAFLQPRDVTTSLAAQVLLSCVLWNDDLTRTVMESMCDKRIGQQVILWAMVHDSPDEIDLEALRYLVDNAGISLAARSAESNTPLHLAAKNGSLRKCEALLVLAEERKEDIVNLQNDDGDTPLIFMVRSHEQYHFKYRNYLCLDVIKCLLREGALIDVRNNAGQTVIDVIHARINGLLSGIRNEAAQTVIDQLEHIRAFLLEYGAIRVSVSEIDRVRRLDELSDRWSRFGPIPRGVWAHVRETLTGGDKLLDRRKFVYFPSH